MAGLVVWIVSVALIVVGLGFVFALRGDIARFLSLRRKPTSIASISRPGTYHVRGRAVASEQGLLKAPLTGRDVLVYRVYINKRRPPPQGGTFTADTVRGQVEFFVDDGSGAWLRVNTHEATFILDDLVIFDGTRPFCGDAPPEVLQWTTQRMGHPRDNVRVRERVIEPGLQLSLIGPTSVEYDPRGGQLRKMTSPTTGALFVTSPSGGARSLLVKQLIFAGVLLVLGHGGCVASCAMP